jgi:uncharacterized protein with HEPN domain
MPSDPEKTRRWLSDILYHIDLATGFAAWIDYDTFQNDLLRFHAVTRCLEVISEASRRLPTTLKARHPSIPWRQMAAAGNVYRHDYDGVAARRVWQTLQLALPPLRAVVAGELASATASDRPASCHPPRPPRRLNALPYPQAAFIGRNASAAGSEPIGA